MRSLYGLKQASHLWNKYMDQRMKTIGFHPTLSDSAVYIRRTNLGETITAIHVDNFLTFASCPAELKSARTQIHELFEMKEEDPDWMLGFRIVEDRKSHTMAIDHSQYVNTILKRFRMEECDPKPTPMEPNVILSKEDSPDTPEEMQRMKRYPYRELVGAILWISIISRPDLAFVASHLAQYNANPGPTHWQAANNVLRYISGTRDY